ncbi:hypothetical protein ACPTIV_29300 [Pseudomonas aeruginosa]
MSPPDRSPTHPNHARDLIKHLAPDENSLDVEKPRMEFLTYLDKQM